MLRNTVFVILVSFALVSELTGQVPFSRRCPNYEAQANFDVAKYLGKWYEQMRYFAVFEFGGKCVTADYSLNENGTVHVLNQQTSAITGMEAQIDGYAELVDVQGGSAKLAVTFPSIPVKFAAPYWVLETDYEHYSVVWSCTNFGLFSSNSAWVLTRDRFPAPEVVERINNVIDKFKIEKGYFIKTDQQNCPKTH